jgi:hypothetical protein
MSYKIYTDKNENFECEVSVKNASLKGSIARLIVESSDGPTLVFKGELNGDKCTIPIKRLKGILDESSRGNMHLEVIVEDTYFRPWESDFVVEEHTSVKVRVDEQKQSSNKPIVKIKVPVVKVIESKAPAIKTSTIKPTIKRKGINVFVPKKEIATICEQFGIRKNNFQKRKRDFLQILKEYFKVNPEYNYHTRTILSGIDDFLR